MGHVRDPDVRDLDHSRLRVGRHSGLTLNMDIIGVRPTFVYKNSSGDEIANVNFYAVRPEATRIR